MGVIIFLKGQHSHTEIERPLCLSNYRTNCSTKLSPNPVAAKVNLCKYVFVAEHSAIRVDIDHGSVDLKQRFRGNSIRTIAEI